MTTETDKDRSQALINAITAAKDKVYELTGYNPAEVE